jgi:hypothetical protein
MVRWSGGQVGIFEFQWGNWNKWSNGPGRKYTSDVGLRKNGLQSKWRSKNRRTVRMRDSGVFKWKLGFKKNNITRNIHTTRRDVKAFVPFMERTVT